MMIGLPMGVAEVLTWCSLICSVPAAFAGGADTGAGSCTAKVLREITATVPCFS